MNTPRDDHDLDALLRQPTERLAPPDGSWELVIRRARRRRWAKASASVAACLVVVAGAVPAVIAVRHNSSDDQTLGIAASAGPHSARPSAGVQPAPKVSSTSPAPAVPTSLAGFVPKSLSFISQDVGFLWGSVGTSHRGVVARTLDDGAHWTELPAPKVDDTVGTTGNGGDGQIRFGRFGNTTVGFVYGAKYFVTTDAGASWTQYVSPGYIDDLETMAGKVWALARTSQLSSTVRLYSATLGDPALRRVPGVAPMSGPPGVDSIAVNDRSVDVIVGSSTFLTSPGGVRWNAGKDPCQPQAGLGNVESTLLTTLNLGVVITGCGYNENAGAEDKRIFVTANAGKRWTPTTSNPLTSGYLENLAAGTTQDLIIGTTGGGAQITHDGGKTWQPLTANGAALGFVGFIDIHHIVAAAAPAESTVGAFANSTDTGKSWAVMPFPN